MGYDYSKKIKPIGQIHGNACWAASISWWLSAQSLNGKRRAIEQVELINKFGDLLNFSGSMSIRNIRKVCENAEIRIDLKFVTAPVFKKDFNIDSPVIVIYNYPKVGGTHMNVLFNQSGETVMAMEPYYPFPGEDGRRSGQYVRRPMSFFCNSEEIGIGYLPLADAFKQLDT